MTSNQITCPLCGDCEMEYKELPKKTNTVDNKTYVWICEMCPGILMEWSDKRDTEALAEYLERS